jgi:EF-hand domain pair
MTRYAFALLGAALACGAVSDAMAQARTGRTSATVNRDVQQMLREMDTDKNGSVSKDEFMNYMSQAFDRLDVNQNRSLEPAELRPFAAPYWYRHNRDPHNDR